MEETKVIYPVSGIIITALDIDNVDESETYGICISGLDIERGYTRWKTIMESPNPYQHEFSEPSILDFNKRLATAEAESQELQNQMEIDQNRNLTLVGDVADREREIRELGNELGELNRSFLAVKSLAEGREREIKQAKATNERLQAQIKAYRRRYKSADRSLNFIQKFIKFIFRI